MTRSPRELCADDPDATGPRGAEGRRRGSGSQRGELRVYRVDVRCRRLRRGGKERHARVCAHACLRFCTQSQPITHPDLQRTPCRPGPGLNRHQTKVCSRTHTCNKYDRTAGRCGGGRDPAVETADGGRGVAGFPCPHPGRTLPINPNTPAKPGLDFRILLNTALQGAIVKNKVNAKLKNILLPSSWSHASPLAILQFATRGQAKTLISFEKAIFQVKRLFSEPEEDVFELRLNHTLQKISLEISSAPSFLH